MSISISEQLVALAISRHHFERAADFIESMIRGNRHAHAWAVMEIESCFESLKKALDEPDLKSASGIARKEAK